MISLIICSRIPHINKELSDNIQATIGTIPYEIIWLDNSNNQYSIFQAYKEGTEKAKYNILCFMHEDILFHTQGWGKLVINHLQDSDVGLLGVMGTHYLDAYSLYYHSSGICRGKIIQGYYQQGKYKTKIDERYKFAEFGNNVVAIDGLWMASKKELFINGILFWDIDTFDGFHLYDMDISLQTITKGKKIKIADNILIEHKSGGGMTQEFFQNCLKFHRKWNSYLPVYTPLTSKEAINTHYLNYIESQKHTQQLLDNYKAMINKLPYRILTRILLAINYKIWRE
ncbi:glycosyltransferase [uncultured Bacteroides sp.]|uniref:glycosyltransferase n=1 Tax=uncultured Bacteroides sp. TaxID=162156 RepID=UPI00263410A9|nr:glycosyltransferase [uncultured Bacteroides sp.]